MPRRAREQWSPGVDFSLSFPAVPIAADSRYPPAAGDYCYSVRHRASGIYVGPPDVHSLSVDADHNHLVGLRVGGSQARGQTPDTLVLAGGSGDSHGLGPAILLADSPPSRPAGGGVFGRIGRGDLFG